jgi:hypothetical protein
MLNKVFFFQIITVVVFAAYSCTDEEVRLNNFDLVFPNSYWLKINAYSYYDTYGNKFEVKGDTFYYTHTPDSLNNMPTLKWDSLGIGIFTAVISTKSLKVVNDEIVNINNIIWQWHSGMEYGREGLVKYSEGKSVINDTIDYNNEAQPLDAGNYYWAVWGWNNEGTKIFFSSRQMEFYVSE